VTDRFAPEERSRLMSRVRQHDTLPEREVRRCLRSLRIRFRSQVEALPGRPDFVLVDFPCAVFVHGCFWHSHARCVRARRPSSRRSFWNVKLDRNRRRDRCNSTKLRKLGYRIITIWECRLRNVEAVRRRLASCAKT